MSTEGFIDREIKPQLVDQFGRQAANSLLTQATLAYVSTDGTELERYEAFLQTLASDDRIAGAWDSETLAGQLSD